MNQNNASVSDMLSSEPINGQTDGNDDDTGAAAVLVAGEGEGEGEGTVEEQASADQGAEGDEGAVEGEGADDSGDSDGGSEEEPKDVDPAMQAVDAMREEMAGLQETITALTMNVAAGNKKEEAAPTFPDFEYSDFDVLTSDDAYENAMKDRNSFNKVLNLMGEYASAKAIEHVTKHIPALVGSEALKAANTTFMIKTFWRENKDIKKLPNAQTKVSAIYNQLETLNPAAEAEEIFDMLGAAVRKKHGLKAPKGTIVTPTKDKGKPAFASTGGSRNLKPTNAPKTIADEISAMESL